MDSQFFLTKQWFIDSHQGNIKDQYHFKERLGAGGFGVVYLAEHKKNGELYAVKAIQKSRVRDYETFQNEIKILIHLDHPNIIKLYEIWEWQSICFLVTEYCEGGELFYTIVNKRSLTEKEAAIIMKQSFSALKYLHENNICHRDIKPENFLLKYKEDITNVKLIDFGLSNDYSDAKVMQTPVGSPYYIAPEVFDSSYDSKCDLWSMGVVLYILLSGKVPFPGESNKEIIENVTSGKYHFAHEEFKVVSSQAKDLISKLLVKDASKRYTAADAYNHPMIQNIESNLDVSIASEAFDNMRKFIEAANFKKATLVYLASKLPEKNLDELRRLFIQIDKNGDGKITLDEFVKALEGYGLKYSEAETKQLMNKLDTNLNGCIDYTEFLAGCMKSKVYLQEEQLKNAFSYFDKDQSGTISLDELKQVLRKGEVGLSDTELEKILRQVDENKDNQIDYNEFIEMMKNDLTVRLAVYNSKLSDLLIYRPQCNIF